VLLCLAVVFYVRRGKHEGRVYVYAVPVKTKYGWGYNIMAGEKIFIKQEFIPAISGKLGFKSADDALRTGNLVVKRICANQSRAITPGDLDSLGITKN
jgi:hypothetical protein